MAKENTILNILKVPKIAIKAENITSKHLDVILKKYTNSVKAPIVHLYLQAPDRGPKKVVSECKTITSDTFVTFQLSNFSKFNTIRSSTHTFKFTRNNQQVSCNKRKYINYLMLQTVVKCRI